MDLWTILLTNSYEQFSFWQDQITFLFLKLFPTFQMVSFFLASASTTCFFLSVEVLSSNGLFQLKTNKIDYQINLIWIKNTWLKSALLFLKENLEVKRYKRFFYFHWKGVHLNSEVLQMELSGYVSIISKKICIYNCITHQNG